MQYDGCDHVGHRVYARRVFKNGTVHHCVQCTKCLNVIKLPKHGDRPWIRQDEIPEGVTIHPFINRGVNND